MGRKLPLLPYVRRLTSKNLVTCPSALSKMLLKGNEDDFLPSPLFFPSTLSFGHGELELRLLSYIKAQGLNLYYCRHIHIFST